MWFADPIGMEHRVVRRYQVAGDWTAVPVLVRDAPVRRAPVVFEEERQPERERPEGAWRRYAEAAMARRAGLTYREIGRLLGVSGGRAKELVVKGEECRGAPLSERLMPLQVGRARQLVASKGCV